MWAKFGAAMSFATVFTGCTHSGVAPTPTSICRAHLSGVVAAEANTVRGVAEVGPQTVPPHRGQLGEYDGETRVSLCLVPGSGPGQYEAVAITPDGSSHVVWTQSGAGTQFLFPA